MPELCQMWKRREGGDTHAFHHIGTPPRIVLKPPPSRDAAPRVPESPSFGGTSPGQGVPAMGGVESECPPAAPPLHPPRCSGREEEERGQGPAGRERAGEQAGAGTICHAGGAALPGCLCVPVALGGPGQGVPREEEAAQLCRGEVARVSSPLPFSFSPTTPGDGAEFWPSVPSAAFGAPAASPIPAGGAGTPCVPPLPWVAGMSGVTLAGVPPPHPRPAPRILILLPASLSRSPHPCPAPRILVLLPVCCWGRFPLSPCTGVSGLAGTRFCPTLFWGHTAPRFALHLHPHSATRLRTRRVSPCPRGEAPPGPLLPARGAGDAVASVSCPSVCPAGAAWGPTSASRASAADVARGGCCPRAAGSAPCVSTGSGDTGTSRGPVPLTAACPRSPQRFAPSAAAAACASPPTSAPARMGSRASPAQVPPPAPETPGLSWQGPSLLVTSPCGIARCHPRPWQGRSQGRAHP